MRQIEQRQKGAIAVELALMLPIFLVMILTIVELGSVLITYQVLQNGAREGARISSLPQNNIDPTNPSASSAAIIAEVVNYCNDEGVPIVAGDVTVTQSETVDVNGTAMEVSTITITYSQAMITPGGTALAGGPVEMTAVGVFRNLY